jgi:tyrosyl-tRNA synthetase
MSGSKGNYIALVEDPNEQFGKTMRLSDEMLPDYYRLVMEQEPPADDPMQAKLALARFIVTRAHGAEAADEAEQHFTRVVREHQAPEEVEDVAVADDPVHLPALLAARLGESSSHWRRVIDQGGVKLDGRPVEGYDLGLAEADGAVLQAGKRHFMRLTRG